MNDDIRRVQEKCIEILNVIDLICRKHSIQYSLCGGSVVGAHLYSACLPWDDDIDLMMTRENYDHFLSVALKELPKGLSIHNFQLSREYWSLFTKIVDDNTTVIQQDGSISGVFLDITVYDKIPDNVWKNEDILLWKISQVVMIGKMQSKNIKSILRNYILEHWLTDKRSYFLYFQKRVIKNSNKSKRYYYSELFGAYCNTKPYAPSIFENYTEILFEDKKYMIVRDYVQYLETRYERTDFHEPKDKQIAPHYKYIDLETPYKDYIKSQTLYNIAKMQLD